MKQIATHGESNPTMMTRFIRLVKKLSFKYIHRECVDEVKRVRDRQGWFSGKVEFKIDQIGPDLDNGNRDSINVLIPEWLEPFTDIEIWVHEFVEHTLGNLLIQMAIFEKVCYRDMPETVTLKHFITCLSTFSGVDNEKHYLHIGPDEYIKSINLTELILIDESTNNTE